MCSTFFGENFLLHHYIPPPLSDVYLNDRLKFFEHFDWKIKRINNADLFSQPPLLIIIKEPYKWSGLWLLKMYTESVFLKLIAVG